MLNAEEPQAIERCPFTWRRSAVAAVGLAVAYFWPLGHLPAIPICWFKRITGLPCPSCGITRSFQALAHGEFALAWRYNPLGYLVFGIALVVLTGPLIRRFAPTIERLPRNRRLLTRGLAVTLLALVAFGGVRLYAVWHPEVAAFLHINPLVP